MISYISQQTMKVYTFNAPETTRVEILSSLRPQNQDPIFTDFINQARYTEVDSIQDCQIAIYPYRAFQPETLEPDLRVYDAASTAERFGKPLIIDATCDSDVALNIPSAYILRCGLYQSLQQPFETESPFWSNYRTKKALDALTIKMAKGKKPVVGFCGTTASTGKLANLSKFLVPIPVVKSTLSQGKLARQVDIRIKEGMSLKLREKAMELLSLDRRIDTCFDVTNTHQSYYCKDDTNRIILENLFVENSQKSDYVLCVRGTGNYSGRFYMALNAGRIPIVLDTDLVIPCEEQLEIVKIPLNSLEQIADIVLEHFETKTEAELQTIKAHNRQVYQQFLAPDKFFPNFLQQISF